MLRWSFYKDSLSDLPCKFILAEESVNLYRNIEHLAAARYCAGLDIFGA
jgi:hypothetical protein